MPHESGSVNTFREAVVRMRFVKGDTCDCVVDTGFDGALIVPTSVGEQLGFPVVARLVFELVGGARMAADVALTKVEWLGERRDVEVILSESNDALIGTEMFDDAKLVVDYRNGSVIITNDAESL